MKTHNYNAVKLVEEECITFKNGTLFLGFSGPAMIGLVAADMLNRLLEMREIGRIRCVLIPPIILFEEGLMMHPSLLLACPEHQCAGMVFSIPPPAESYYSIADFIIQWSERHGISQIITITSFESETPSTDVLVVAEKENYAKMLEYGGIPLRTGKVEGFQAAILEASLLSSIDASILAVETDERRPDLAKVQQLVEMFLKVTDINIPPEEENSFLNRYKEALKLVFGSENSSTELQKIR